MIRKKKKILKDRYVNDVSHVKFWRDHTTYAQRLQWLEEAHQSVGWFGKVKQLG